MDRETIQQLRTRKSLDDKLLKYKGAIGVDVEYKRVQEQRTGTFSITVYVKKKLVKTELLANEAIPVHIEGIPTDVVECSNVWPSPESSQQMTAQAKTIQSRADTLEGGLSISNEYSLNGYGTLGIILMSNNTPTALSCSHVMVHPPPQTGQTIIEPGGPQGGKYPADSIGKVSLFSYDNVDAALTPISGRSANVGTILFIGKTNGWGTGQVGSGVKKVGATTGLTSGVISSTTFTWTVSDPNKGTITLNNQIKVDGNFSSPGDSGAAVIESNTNKIVGMVEGGSGGPNPFTVCNAAVDLQRIIPA